MTVTTISLPVVPLILSYNLPEIYFRLLFWLPKALLVPFGAPLHFHFLWVRQRSTSSRLMC